MANKPGCAEITAAHKYLAFIFKENTAALSTLIILYALILSAYILYTNQIEKLSPFNNAIDSVLRSFHSSSFYRQYYIPYIHHYGCKFILFIVLFPMSLMYYDSLFRYRNDCKSITNAWITFSIILMLQFWYLSIKFILYNPEFIALKYEPRKTSTFAGIYSNEINSTPTGHILHTNNPYQQPDYEPRQVAEPNFRTQYVQPSPSPGPFPELGYSNSGNIPQAEIGETEAQSYQFKDPSMLSMNAPKPMQENTEYCEIYNQQDDGAIADYNPFDSDYNEEEQQYEENEYEQNAYTNTETEITDSSPNGNGNGNGDGVHSNGSYVVVDEQAESEPIPHYKISVIGDDSATNAELDHFLNECGCMQYKQKLIQNGLNNVTDLQYESDSNIKFLMAKAGIDIAHTGRFLQLCEDYQNGTFIPGQGYVEQVSVSPAYDQQNEQKISAALPQTMAFSAPHETHLPPPQPRSPTTSMTDQKQQKSDSINVSHEYIRFTSQGSSANLEAEEILSGIKMRQFVKYFKYVTIFFMILCPFVMATTWMFIPYYALNSGSYVYFYVFAAPFVIIYRANMRFMSGEYYNHFNFTNLINDFPFVMFLLKMSSVNFISNFCIILVMNPLDQNHRIAGVLLLFLLPIGSIYPWIILGKMSIELRYFYDKFEKQQINKDMYAFVRPIIPFGQIPHTKPNVYNEPKVVSEQVQQNNKQERDRLESVDLTGDNDENQYMQLRQSKQSIHNTVLDNSTKAKLKRVVSTGAIHYKNNKFRVINVALIVSSVISIIAGSVEQSIAKKQMNDACANVDVINENCFEAINSYSAVPQLMVFAVLLLLIALYNITAECCDLRIIAKAYLMSTDTKQRLVVWVQIMLLTLELTIILMTKQDWTKAIFTILSFISSLVLAVLTFNKKYKILLKLPFKNAKVYAITYVISYFVSTSVMFIMILHCISVSTKQALPIYSYVSLSLLWLFWTLFYNNEMGYFISELDDIPSMKMEYETEEINVFNRRMSAENDNNKNVKQLPISHGSLYLLNELSMVSSFMVFIICCAMASKSYDGAQDAGSAFFLAIYLILSCIIFINAFVAMLSMQSKNEKVYRAAAFEPVLKESLLNQ